MKEKVSYLPAHLTNYGQIMYHKGIQMGRQEGKQEGRQEGKLEGLTEGELKAKVEVVKMMLLNGFEVEVIAKILNYY
jgi:predicted transposase YdaD